MKKTLLSIFALALAANIQAQVSEPTLTLDWKSTDNIPAVANARWGSGYDGNVYVNEKGTGLWRYSYDGTNVTRTAVDGVNVAGAGFNFDGAGNILFSNAWAGGGAMKSLVIYNAATKTTSTVDLTEVFSELGYTVGRMDYIGRGVGDIFSEKGGVFYFVGTSTNIFKVYFKNGSIDTANCKVIESPATADNGSIVVPVTADPSSDEIAFRVRGSKNFYHYSNSAWAQFSSQGDINTTSGGDVVTLGGMLFTLEPAGTNYYDGWQIVERNTNNVVKTIEATSTKNGTGYATVLTAEKLNDTKAYIYHYHPTGFVARYTFEVPKDYLTAIQEVGVDANAPVEYYNLQGVKVENPSNGIFIKRQGAIATKVVL